MSSMCSNIAGRYFDSYFFSKEARFCELKISGSCLDFWAGNYRTCMRIYNLLKDFFKYLGNIENNLTV
ncbi:hypothetical protein V6N13_034167 [Hibiscus sabdariffa]